MIWVYHSNLTIRAVFDHQGPRGQRGPRGATGKPGAKVRLHTWNKLSTLWFTDESCFHFIFYMNVWKKLLVSHLYINIWTKMSELDFFFLNKTCLKTLDAICIYCFWFLPVNNLNKEKKSLYLIHSSFIAPVREPQEVMDLMVLLERGWVLKFTEVCPAWKNLLLNLSQIFNVLTLPHLISQGLPGPQGANGFPGPKGPPVSKRFHLRFLTEWF